MKTLIATTSDTNILDGSEILNVSTSDNHVYRNIARCGLAIEQHLLKDSKSNFWSKNLEYNKVGIIWGSPTTPYTPELWHEQLRGDEILFPSFNNNTNFNWLIGHPRSVVKLAAGCVDLDRDLKIHNRGDVEFSKSIPMRLVWLAFRIGLKPYSLTVA